MSILTFAFVDGVPLHWVATPTLLAIVVFGVAGLTVRKARGGSGWKYAWLAAAFVFVNLIGALITDGGVLATWFNLIIAACAAGNLLLELRSRGEQESRA